MIYALFIFYLLMTVNLENKKDSCGTNFYFFKIGDIFCLSAFEAIGFPKKKKYFL